MSVAGDLARRVERLPHPLTLTLCAAAIIVIGLVDVAAGDDVVLSLFYVLPVALTAWLAGLRVGVVFAIGANVVWAAADHVILDSA